MFRVGRHEPAELIIKQVKVIKSFHNNILSYDNVQLISI